MRCLRWHISDPKVYSPILILRFAIFSRHWQIYAASSLVPLNAFVIVGLTGVESSFAIIHHLFFQTSHLALSFPFNLPGFKSILPSTVCAAYVSSDFLSYLNLDLFRSECGGPVCYSPLQSPAWQVPVFTGYCTEQK